MFFHVFVNIFVADSGLCVFNADLVKCLVKSEIRHYCCNNCIVFQFSLLHEIFTTYIHNAVSVYNISILINSDTTVCISIKCQTQLTAMCWHVCHQLFHVGRTTVVIDIRAVWLCTQHTNLCTQCGEERFCGCRGTAVCTVQCNLHPVKSSRDTL